MSLRKAASIILLIILAGMLAACGPKPENQAQDNFAASPSATSQPEAGGSKKTAATGKDQRWYNPPEMTIKPDKSYSAVLETRLGNITIELFVKDVPETVNSFVFLAGNKFYDGVKIHRIIQSFMIQSGDPLGTGMGGPGYVIPDELPIKYPYDVGIVAMANTGAQNTGGSQFFICSGEDCKSLNSNPIYTVFGRVTSGLDVLQAVAAIPVELQNGELSTPTEEISFTSIKIEEK